MTETEVRRQGTVSYRLLLIYGELSPFVTHSYLEHTSISPGIPFLMANCLMPDNECTRTHMCSFARVHGRARV